jgi:CelD/BcsL family acetyltransferase involved in cellulose biosynthesis
MPDMITALHSAVTTAIMDDPAWFAQSRDEWNDLLRHSSADGPFLTWEWLWTWWRHLAGPRRLAVLAVWSGDELIAAAPLCVRPARPLRGRLLPVLEFLASGTVGSDYLDLIVRRGCEAGALPLLAAEAAKAAAGLRFERVRPGESQAAQVTEVLAANGWRVTNAAAPVCPYIPLQDHSWESYLEGLGAEQRYNFRRKLRRIEKDFRVDWDEVQTPGESSRAVDLLVRFHQARWRERGDALHQPALVAFHKDFAALALQRGWLRLYLLRLNGQPAAALYGFLYRRIFYFYQSGFDAAFARYSVGLVTMGLAIRRAIEEGALEYDLLHGEEDYKAHWTSHRRRLETWELGPPGIPGTIYFYQRRLRRAAARFTRRLLRRPAL